MAKDNLDALVSPTTGATWAIAATAGYPYITVPLGLREIPCVDKRRGRRCSAVDRRNRHGILGQGVERTSPHQIRLRLRTTDKRPRHTAVFADVSEESVSECLPRRDRNPPVLEAQMSVLLKHVAPILLFLIVFSGSTLGQLVQSYERRSESLNGWQVPNNLDEKKIYRFARYVSAPWRKW